MSRKHYYMPAEYDKHFGTVMIWPVREGSFPDKAAEAQKAFAETASVIAQSEPVYMLYDKERSETLTFPE